MGNTPSKTGNGEEPVKTTLFQQESDGTTYRIPALIYLKHNQTFLAFAEKRTSPSDNDAKFLVMRRGTPQDDGSIQWSSSEELSTASLPNHRTMNPCPVYEKDNKTLFLFFICVLGKTSERAQICTGNNKARLCYVTSSDDGQTWSDAKDLTESVIGETIHRWATFAVGPGHGIQMKSGRLIIPAYTYYIPCKCFCCPVPFTVHPYALSIYSDDSGKTWKIGEKLQEKSSECEMAEIDHAGTSHLYCNARNTGCYRWEALSKDRGDHFDKPRMAPELVEQCCYGCQGSVIGFPAPEFVPNDEAEGKGAGDTSHTQTWLLFTHPTDRNHRRDLGVYLNRSPLHSSGWGVPMIIHSGPSGYSDLAYNQDKEQFACLMECGTESELEQIAFVSFTLNDVMKTAKKK